MTISNSLIVEDEVLFQELLSGYLAKALPDAKPPVLADSCRSAAALIESQNIELAIIDISLPDGRGCELIPQLKKRDPKTICVVITIADDEDTVFECLQMGADGYLLKNEPGSVLIEKLQDILKGAPPLSAEISKKILKSFHANKQEQPQAELTPREAEILSLISRGLNRTDIAKLLKLSRYTIADHVKAIYRKLGISSRAEATRMAIKMGLD